MNRRYELLGNGAGMVLTAIQTEHTFQIISLILTCISIAFSVAFTFYKWIKDAKKDGKIDKEEVKEAMKELYKGVKDINDEIDKFKGDK